MGKTRSREANPIDVIEAAYDLECDSREWLRRLATTVRPILDAGHGVIAYFYDVTRPPPSWLESAVTFDPPRGYVKLVAATLTMSAETAQSFHNAPGPLEASAIAVGGREGVDRHWVDGKLAGFRQIGISDFCALRTVEPSGKGVVISAGHQGDRHYDQRTKRLWARVAAHIAAGRRLRETINAQATEAVLTPAGRLEHADGAGRSRTTRELLRDAVLRQERARGRGRRDDPERATEAWTALVSGRWSLVDRFERGGRRYVVALRNDHLLPDPRTLGARERTVFHLAALGKSNKLIAYELGIAASTVGTHLAAVMRKFGVSSRIELIRLVAQTSAMRAPKE